MNTSSPTYTGLASRGARVILLPAQFNLTTGPAHWELALRSRAVDNECFVVGASGEVVALEANPVVAFLIEHGLQTFTGEHPLTEAAMRRIKVVASDYLDYLRTQPDDSFDAVYFDPMFRHPFEESSGIHPLRRLADPRPLSPEAVAEACRVARRRVVLKESSRSLEFDRLGFRETVGGKYSHIRYGVIRRP